MKSFAAALLVASAKADEYADAGHYHNDYNTGYASSAPLLTPNFSEQIDAVCTEILFKKPRTISFRFSRPPTC